MHLQPDAAQDTADQGCEQRDAHAVDDLAQDVFHTVDVFALPEAVSQAADRDHEADDGANQAEQDQGARHVADDLDGRHQPDTQRGSQQILVDKGALLVVTLGPQLGKVVRRHPLRTGIGKARQFSVQDQNVVGTDDPEHPEDQDDRPRQVARVAPQDQFDPALQPRNIPDEHGKGIAQEPLIE